MLATLLLATGVTVTLAPDAEVKGLEIAVGEVAAVTVDDPADADLVARIEAASLGYAPAPGYHRLLRGDLVQADLRRAFPGVDLRVDGADRCRVEPMVETLEEERFWGLAMAEIERLFQGTDAAIKRGGSIAGIDVPLGAEPSELRTVVADDDVEAGPKSIGVQVYVDGDLYRTVHVPFEISLREPRWVPVRAIPAGVVLEPRMFELKRIEIGFTSAMHGLPVDALAGTIAARPLPAGRPVTERDVQRPIVIHRGQVVTVHVSSGPVNARDMGLAQADGKVGEMVRVKLSSTGREVTGRVTGAGEVEIKIR